MLAQFCCALFFAWHSTLPTLYFVSKIIEASLSYPHLTRADLQLWWQIALLWLNQLVSVEKVNLPMSHLWAGGHKLHSLLNRKTWLKESQLGVSSRNDWSRHRTIDKYINRNKETTCCWVENLAIERSLRDYKRLGSCTSKCSFRNRKLAAFQVNLPILSRVHLFHRQLIS